MKRVLIVSHVIPCFPGPGAEARAFCLTRYLQASFDITYVLPDYGAGRSGVVDALKAICAVETYHTSPKWTRIGWWKYRIGQYLEPLRSYCISSRTPQMVRAIQLILPALAGALHRVNWKEFDLFHVIHPHTADVLRKVNIPIPRTLDWIDERTTVPRREMKAQSARKRIASSLEIRRIERYQRWAVQQFDATFIASDLDADRMQQCTQGKRPVVVPNGVDLEYFHNPMPDRPRQNDLIFTGHMAYEPNVDAVLFFCREILPRVLAQVPDTRLVVVGTQPHPSLRELEQNHNGKVIVAGEVPDVRPYMIQAAVSVVPLRNGGGTRLKIVEAMAMHRPVVTTTIGCEGLLVQDGREVCMRDDPDDFANAVVQLLKEPETWRQTADLGLTLVQQSYNWQSIADRLADVWLQVMDTEWLRHRK